MKPDMLPSRVVRYTIWVGEGHDQHASCLQELYDCLRELLHTMDTPLASQLATIILYLRPI